MSTFRSRNRARARFAVRWLVPDLALAAAVFAVIGLFLLLGGPSALFRDSDSGWHIRIGERMISTYLLPRVDVFSFSRAGDSWISWEWGADFLMGGAHRLEGLGGVAFIYTVTIAASVWMWVRLNWAAGGSFLLTCLFAAPMLSTMDFHWLARPHVFGWLFVVGTVWFCERMPSQLNAKLLLAVGAGGAAWANIHGSFFVGPLIALVYAAGVSTGSLLWDTRSIAPKNYLLAALAGAAGTLINPYGWHLHQHVLAYLLDSALLDRVAEFQSFNFHAAGSGEIVLALLIGAGGGFAALWCKRLERFLLAMLLTGAALRSARMLQVAALVLLPLANGSITSVLVNVTLKTRLRKRLDAALDYGLALRAIDRTVKGYALMPAAALILFFATNAAHPAFPAERFPVESMNAVETLPADARIFSSDSFGGYLIYRFAGARKVFFDGRSDFYGADFVAGYSRMIQARPGWREEFAGWRFTHALLPVNSALGPALESEGWRILHRDRTAVLLKKP